MNNYNPMNMPNNQAGMFSNPTNVMSAPSNSSMALPKHMQDALDLVAYEKKLKEARSGNTGESSREEPPMSQELIDFFDTETETQKHTRMNNFLSMFNDAAISGIFGLPGMLGSAAVAGINSLKEYGAEQAVKTATATTARNMNGQGTESRPTETREGSNGNVGMGGGNASRGFSSGGW